MFAGCWVDTPAEVPQISYHGALTDAMSVLGKYYKNTIFIGQGVGCAGTTMTDTLDGVPKDKLLEFPVAEDLQMGTAIGMALGGWLPICIFPRWNFLICAANQIVNHLDKLSKFSSYNPKVIIRVATPIANESFDPGPQHNSDFSNAFASMLEKVRIVKLLRPEWIMREYETAANADHSTLLVEYTEMYKAIPSGVK